MSFWLTTHFPHHSPTHPWNIYLRDRFKQSFEKRIAVGDGVAFYELLGEGTGRQAVVGFARVSGAIQRNTHRERSVEEGDRVWEWELPCTDHEFGGPISQNEVYRILKWNPRRPPLLAGGLVEITSQQFDLLHSAFRH
jgi:hypothetical protein